MGTFLWKNQQYQLDIYRSPCHSRCQGMILLETFTTSEDEEVIPSLPPFLRVKKSVTGDPAFSMFNLSLRSEWTDSAEEFCHKLSSDDESEEDAVYDVKQAHERLILARRSSGAIDEDIKRLNDMNSKRLDRVSESSESESVESL